MSDPTKLTRKQEAAIGFLLRLLEARYDVLYQTLTRQNDITPRQFGVLMALYQGGPLTPSVLAERISCDRNTLSEMLKRMAPDYQTVSHRQIGLEEIRSFFAPGEAQTRGFPNDQMLDREEYLGRLISSSYVPNIGQSGHREIVEAAGKIFDAHQTAGKISFNYETKLYLGRIK